MTKQELINRIEELKDSLTGEMLQDMNIRNEIHRLEMELNETRPQDSSFDCEGCGS
jgi:hypothetical protein